MGLMDKVKAQATQLAQQAQQGMQQGQAKLSEMQIRKQADALLRDLGAAVYAVQRQGGSHEPVQAALDALDAHVAAHGPIDTAPTAHTTAADAGTATGPGPTVGTQPGPQAGPTPTPPPSAGAPAGDFNLDDL